MSGNILKRARLILNPRLFLARLLRRSCRRGSGPGEEWINLHLRRFLPQTDEPVVTPWGFMFNASPREYGSYRIYFYGDYDPAMSMIINTHLREGETAWDIGADLGWFTVLMATSVGPTGRVDCFEAFPPNAQRLRQNLALNDVTWVKINQLAVSDTSGRGQFLPPEDVATHDPRLHICGSVGHLTEKRVPGSFELSTVSLDEYELHHPVERLSLIKLDIEGAEVQALRGASRVLDQFRPILAVEYNRQTLRRSATNWNELDGLLEAHGYDRFVYDHRRFRKFDLSEWQAVPDSDAVFNVYAFPRLR